MSELKKQALSDDALDDVAGGSCLDVAGSIIGGIENKFDELVTDAAHAIGDAAASAVIDSIKRSASVNTIASGHNISNIQPTEAPDSIMAAANVKQDHKA